MARGAHQSGSVFECLFRFDPVAGVQLSPDFVDTLCLGDRWQQEVRELLQNRVEIHNLSRTTLRDFAPFLNSLAKQWLVNSSVRRIPMVAYVEQLLQSGIAEIWATIPKDHLGGERVAEPSQVVEQIFSSRCVQETFKKKFILEVLVRYILRGDLDVQDVVHQLMDRSPCIAIFLICVRISKYSQKFRAVERVKRAVLTIITNLWPPLAMVWLINKSGRSE